MADEIDIEALLEEAYKNKDQNRKSSVGKSDRKKSSRKRSRSSSRKRSRSRSRKHRRSKSRSKDAEKRRRRSRSRDRAPKIRKRTPTPPPNRVPLSELEPLTEEERDARTVFVRQLAREARAKDIEEFFRPVGRIRDVRMITDRNSHRSKGIAYVEFANIESVSHAMTMSGQKLLSQPVLIQPTMSEKNRAAMEAAALAKQQGPAKLFVASLHPNITEPMLRAIFEPFGHVDNVQLQYDKITGNSKGVGFITYKEHDHARHALEKLNGYELVGRAIRVGFASDRGDYATIFEEEDNARDAGTSKSGLSKRLAGNRDEKHDRSRGRASDNGPSPCLVLSGMFNPSKERGNSWAEEIEEDIRAEVTQYASLSHIHVDKESPEGNIYLRLSSPESAANLTKKLKGRLYSGREIDPVPVPLSTYEEMFPNS